MTRRNTMLRVPGAVAVVLIIAACGATSPSRQPQGQGNAPACSATALFNAAVVAEHLNPHDPGYAPLPPGDRAGAYNVHCDGQWAIAAISRPRVGTTDGITLFHADSSAHWAEAATLGGQPADCQLAKAGVPNVVATVLVPPSQSYNGPGGPCNPAGSPSPSN